MCGPKDQEPLEEGNCWKRGMKEAPAVGPESEQQPKGRNMDTGGVRPPVCRRTGDFFGQRA